MNTVYQVMNARYRTLSRFQRRMQPRAGRTKRNIFIGSLRISPNSAHPHRMSLAQLKAHEEQVREHLENHDIVILGPDGRLVTAEELFSKAVPKEKAEPKPELPAGKTVEGDDYEEPKGTDKDDEPDAPAAEPDEKEPEEEPSEDIDEALAEAEKDLEDEPSVEEEPELEPEKVEAVEYDTSVLDGSVAKLEEALEDIEDEAHLEALLAAEKGNKNRKGAAAAIEEQLAFVRGE